MAENLGAIRYDVEVGTAGMLKAETVVGKSTTNVANDFKKIDAAAKNTSTQMTKAAAGVKKGVQANLGQAGIQVQQFVGQLQGGQSAMVALAQQSADLGIVLGAPMIGVIVSLAAVLAGTLAPAIFGSVSGIERLQKAIENTKAVMSVGANGIVEYTEEMKRLNTASETLARIKIALAMTQNAEAMKGARKEAASLRLQLFGFQETAQDAAERLTGLTSKAGEIQNIALAMKDFNSATSDDKKLKALEKAEKLLLGLSKDGVFPTKELAEYAQTFFDFSDAIRQTITNNKALKESQDELEESNKITKDSFDDMKNALRGNIIELKSGERAALKWSLLMQGLDADQQAEILTLYDKKVALEAANKATDEAIRANEAYDKSVIKKTESDLAWFEQQEKWLANKDKQATATLTTQVQSIGLTPEEEIQARYAKELELLRQAEEQKIEIEGTYAQRRVQIEAERQEAIKGLQSNTNEFMENAFGNLETQIAGTMAQVITGAKDGREAMSALANTILTQVIGAVVQWGIAEVTKLFTVESAEKSMQAANAAATAASVSAQVGMNTALAAQNAFMATAAIPIIGPALAPAAAAAAGATSAALGASAVPLAPLAGAREFGGPVSNGMYRVNETGIPEVYSQGGKDYLMNTKNANITPLDKAGGGQQAWNINVQNNGPEKAYVTIDEVNRAVNVGIGREAKLASQGRGNMLKALSSSTNVRNKANRG